MRNPQNGPSLSAKPSGSKRAPKRFVAKKLKSTKTSTPKKLSLAERQQNLRKHTSLTHLTTTARRAAAKKTLKLTKVEREENRREQAARRYDKRTFEEFLEKRRTK
jgi:DNA polymerase IIIc chi subunit